MTLRVTHGFAARGLAAALGLACLAASAAPVQRGVVTDDANGVVYMLPDGGIEALDAATGATRWRSDAADLPVLATRTHVFALRDAPERGVLAWTILDAATGEVVASRGSELPAPARALVDERLGERFEIVPAPGEDRFDWTYTLETVPGAVLVDAHRTVGESGETGADPVSRVVLGGSVRVDFARGEVETRVDREPVRRVAAVESRDLPALGGRRFVSASRAELLASERVGDTELYRWRVHARDGRRLGELESRYAYLPFAVVGDSIVYASPLRFERDGAGVAISPVSLEGVDLASGERRWRRELRDTSYRGPYPQ